MKIFTPALFVLIVLQSNKLAAQAGSLDVSFNKIGTLSISQLGTNQTTGCFAAAIEQNGKIILAGAADTTLNGINGPVLGNAWALVCINKKGIIDTTFGYKGHEVTSVTQVDDVANSVAIKNGNIFVAGLTSGPPMESGFFIDDMAVLTYKTNGSFPPFGGPPSVLVIFDRGHDTTCAVVTQKDGKVIGAGVVQTNSSTQNDFGVFRVVGSVSLDGSFNGTGKVTTDFSGTNDGAYAVTMDGSKIIAAGYTTDGSGKRIPALARYDSSGKLDPTFGTGGKVIVSNESLGPIRSIKMIAGGKIIAVCTMHTTANSMALLQFKNSGALDKTFGSAGIAHSAFTGTGYSLAIEASTGKIIVSGSTGSSFELARFKPNGSADSTFGTNGEVITSSLPGTAYAVAIDPDGKYVIAGTSFGAFEVARYLSGLTLLKQDFEMKGNTSFIYPNPVHTEATLNYTLPENENVSISLFDMSGKLVKQFINNENESEGINQQTLNMESLPAGEYMLQLKTPSQNISVKVIKQ
jgi:uncharacterized delta-60 repeat protein